MEDRGKAALDLILRYGGYDGSHHKQWVLDQVVRTLLGSEDEYKKWCAEYSDGEDGPNTYGTWDEGIAP